MSQTFRPTSFFSRLVNNIVQRNIRKQGEEVLVGIDYKGNRYYEQVGGSMHQRRVDGVVLPKRWYFPAEDNEENWDQHIPPEWEAWMRYRRIESPTEEEINLNLAVAHMKQVNAAKLEEQRTLLTGGQEQLNTTQPNLTESAVQPAEASNTAGYNKETGENPIPKFPVYEEYEDLPGQGTGYRQRRKDRHNPFID